MSKWLELVKTKKQSSQQQRFFSTLGLKSQFLLNFGKAYRNFEYKKQWSTTVFLKKIKKTAVDHPRNKKKKTAVGQWSTAVFLPALQNFGDNKVSKTGFFENEKSEEKNLWLKR